jgi:hypothetical protein
MSPASGIFSVGGVNERLFLQEFYPLSFRRKEAFLAGFKVSGCLVHNTFLA